MAPGLAVPAGPTVPTPASPEAEYEAQLQTLAEVRRSIADVMASRRRLEAQADEVRRRIADLQAQAADAAARGQDDLARSALKESLGVERQLAKRQALIDDLRRREAELGEASARLQARSEEYRARLDAAQARAAAAEAERAAEAARRPRL